MQISISAQVSQKTTTSYRSRFILLFLDNVSQLSVYKRDHNDLIGISCDTTTSALFIHQIMWWKEQETAVSRLKSSIDKIKYIEGQGYEAPTKFFVLRFTRFYGLDRAQAQQVLTGV